MPIHTPFAPVVSTVRFDRFSTPLGVVGNGKVRIPLEGQYGLFKYGSAKLGR